VSTTATRSTHPAGSAAAVAIVRGYVITERRQRRERELARIERELAPRTHRQRKNTRRFLRGGPQAKTSYGVSLI